MAKMEILGIQQVPVYGGYSLAVWSKNVARHIPRIMPSSEAYDGKKGYPSVVVYLDDFLVIGETTGKCSETNGSVDETTAHIRDCPQPFQNRRTPTTSAVLRHHTGCCVHDTRATTSKNIGADSSLAKDALIPRKRLPSGNYNLGWEIKFTCSYTGLTLLIDKRPIAPVWTDACPVAAGTVCNGEYVYRHLTESIHRDILLKIHFLTISVQKCILNLKQNNIYYGVLT